MVHEARLKNGRFTTAKKGKQVEQTSKRFKEIAEVSKQTRGIKLHHFQSQLLFQNKNIFQNKNNLTMIADFAVRLHWKEI